MEEVKKRRKYEKYPVHNRDVRALIAQYGIAYKDIANAIHISPSQLSVWMRFDLRDWQRKEILGAIAVIRLERGETDEQEKAFRDGRVRSGMDVGMGDYVCRPDVQTVGEING